jgi:hypothetical protein
VAVAGKMREKLIAREPLIAVLPETFPLAAGAKVSLRQLAPHGLVWFPQGLRDAACRYCRIRFGRCNLAQ